MFQVYDEVQILEVEGTPHSTYCACKYSFIHEGLKKHPSNNLIIYLFDIHI